VKSSWTCFITLKTIFSYFVWNGITLLHCKYNVTYRHTSSNQEDHWNCCLFLLGTPSDDIMGSQQFLVFHQHSSTSWVSLLCSYTIHYLSPQVYRSSDTGDWHSVGIHTITYLIIAMLPSLYVLAKTKQPVGRNTLSVKLSNLLCDDIPDGKTR
jgi:hypothetical protein